MPLALANGHFSNTIGFSRNYHSDRYEIRFENFSFEFNMELTITLDQLSNNELQIYNEAGYQQRFSRTRIANTSEDWFFKEYYQIHNEYLKLHEQSNDSFIKLESLKRLIFLNWYFEVEPAYFTGIQSLDKTSIFNSYNTLNFYIKENLLDEEFIWMLSFYSSWEFFILAYSKDKLDELTFFVNNADTSGLKLPKKSLPKGTMNNRGQMGIYWATIAEKD